MTQTLEERMDHLQRVAKFPRCSGLNYPSGAMARIAKESLEIISELQQKYDLLGMDFTASQEIMGGMNQEKEELIKAFNFIRSSDSSTESAAKAIEILKKYE